MRENTGHEPGEKARPNRLSGEKSPYLLQHAGNPVDWYPWGDEAFDRAAREDRPIFLSIGYSTCHWCHVMERESFEDGAVAALLNNSFVSIKVDREERPDIDGVYMDAVILMSGRGGWPLTIIMAPDGRPFFAATYLPREGRFGMPGMLELLPRISELWNTRRPEVLDTASRVSRALIAGADDPGDNFAGGPGYDAATDPYERELGQREIDAGCAELAESFDDRHGGFGDAPKFPTPHNLLFLLRCHARTGDAGPLDMVTRTLTAMRAGGIYDHVGFGFHRYSTDKRWLVPHFEKMLYDQALLLLAYTEAWRFTGEPLFARTSREIGAYILEEMTDPEGGFYSAEDADSEGIEGKFYVWAIDELRETLGDEAEFVAQRFGAHRNGNFSDEATGEPSGMNILHLPEPKVAGSPAEDEVRWERARRRLHESRARRVRPGRDDKILTDWNGLAIAALALAGSALDEPEFVRAAERAADRILADARGAGGRLLHRIRGGEAGLMGLADDHAFMAWGLLELYDATLKPSRLRSAIELTDELLERFWDDERGGVFLTPHDGERLLTRQRKVYDGAVPSSNSVTLMNLLRLAHLTGRSDLETRAALLSGAFAPDIRRHPAAFAHFLSAVDQATGVSSTVVIVGGTDARDTRELLAAMRGVHAPGMTLLFAPSDRESHEDRALIEEIAPFVCEMDVKDGRAAAYICRGRACSQPVTDPAEAARLASNPNQRVS